MIRVTSKLGGKMLMSQAKDAFGTWKAFVLHIRTLKNEERESGRKQPSAAAIKGMEFVFQSSKVEKPQTLVRVKARLHNTLPDYFQRSAVVCLSVFTYNGSPSPVK